MRIKTKLRLTIAASLVTAAMLVSAIIVVGQRTYNVSERSAQYQELSLKMFALQALTDAYLLRHTERTIDQWKSVHESLGALLGGIKPEHDFEEPLLISLATKHRELVLPFSRLMELQSNSEDIAFSMVLKERVSNQISVQLQMMMGDAFGLMQQSRKQILASERQMNHVTVMLVLLLVIVPGGLLLLMSNRIVNSILHLHEATALIGVGDWDHKVRVEGDDEIGRLARAFNEMAGKLRGTYSALEVEVDDRKRAEDELRIHKEQLEQLVEERTGELVAANTQLKQQIEARLQIEKELRESEERIRASLAEKEVLLKEIHHRVKNNMQIISSLVSLQANELQDEAMRAVLLDVTHRVRSMAMVHEKLYQSADLARVEFAEYVRSLLGYLFRAHGTEASEIRLALDLEPVSLSVDSAVPCGLILNELVSNALKHAFRGRVGGEVAVSLHGGEQGQLRLCVRDDGTGLPAGFDWRHAHSLGLRLVQMLAGQLHATVEVSSGEGTAFTITLKRE